MDYRRKIIGSALGALLVTAVLVVPVLAKNPLFGTMDLEFNLLWPEPQDEIPDWAGTILIDGEPYGMLFFAIGSGKAFEDPDRGRVHFFEEIWAIYDMDGASFPGLPNGNAGDWSYWLPKNDPDELIMWGYDEGQTNVQNSKYHMNGDVQYATGEFSDWLGRSVHMNGVIIWYTEGDFAGAPHFAPGTFRIN